MMHSLKRRLTAIILMIILLTISVISILANFFINRQFTEYIKKQERLKEQIITSSLGGQYSELTKKWNLDYVHAIGMFSLYEGYIIKVYDKDYNCLWDAQSHNMNLCNKIMADISRRMNINYPKLNGKFTSSTYDLEQDNKKIGSVSISYFGPFFLSENDFKFLNALNIILIIVACISFLISLIVGHVFAKKISKPILKTVEATKQIAEGHYEVRLEEASNTTELVMLEGSINHLALSLETMEKLRKRLTEDVAHELRTPITILQSYIEMMEEGIWEATTERLKSCNEEVLRIARLVSDLENLAKIESDNLKLDKQKIDLYEIIDMTVKSFEKEISDRGLEIKILGPHPTLTADYDRIRQVVVNLFSNAIKYSKKKCNIIFELFDTKDSAGFSIKDSGIGIPEDELPYIFERFYRADKSRNRLTGGSGIGLTIVKSIIEAHGGSISVESRLGEGSCFKILLPKG